MLGFAAACVADDVSPSDDATTDPTDVLVDTDTDVAPTDTDAAAGWDEARRAAVADALEAHLGWLRAMRLDPVDAAAATMRDHLVEGCATDTVEVDGFVLDGFCRAGPLQNAGTLSYQEGLRVHGLTERTVDVVARWAPVLGEAVDAERPASTRRVYAGMFAVGDTEGPIARLDGTYESHAFGIGRLALYRVTFGGPVDHRFAAPDGFVAAGLVPERLDVTWLVDPGVAAVVAVSGALGGYPGDVAVVTTADGAIAEGAGLCAAEPYGTWSVRFADGVWADVAFDPEVACDGCGRATELGAAVGDVCVTPPPLPPVLPVEAP